MEQASVVVRAIDVGRGNVKYTVGPGTDGRPECALFPALAVPSEHEHVADTLGPRRRTIDIPIDNLFYTVGPDVHLASDIFNSQVLQHDRYCETPEYLALTLGALHYMKVRHVDLLMVGLPVATLKLRKSVLNLEKRLQGTHSLGKGGEVTVAEVKTLAQPAGALLQYAFEQQRVAQLRRERNLIIDPGRRTFDWIVTDGMAIIDKRSHSLPRGMFDVLQVIAQGVSMAMQVDYREYEAIDEALRKSSKHPSLTLFGEKYALGRHLPMARKIAEQAVAEMMHYVGEASDIANIILVGGGGFFFRPAIKAAFPRHQIVEIRDPLFANVSGFWLAGMQMAKNSQRPVAVREESNG